MHDRPASKRCQRHAISCAPMFNARSAAQASSPFIARRQILMRWPCRAVYDVFGQASPESAPLARITTLMLRSLKAGQFNYRKGPSRGPCRRIVKSVSNFIHIKDIYRSVAIARRLPLAHTSRVRRRATASSLTGGTSGRSRLLLFIRIANRLII